MRNPFRKRKRDITAEGNVANEGELKEAFIALCGQWPPPYLSKTDAMRLGLVAATGVAVEHSQAAIDSVFTPEVAIGDEPLDLSALESRLPEFALPHLDTAEEHSQALPDQAQAEQSILLIASERDRRIQQFSAE